MEYYVDIADIDEFAHLLLNLLHNIVVTGGHDGDPGDIGIGGHSRSDALDIVSASRKQSGDPAQNTGVIVDQNLKYFEFFFIFRCAHCSC